MKKLTYWVAAHLYDTPCFSIIGKTKKEVMTQLADMTKSDYAPVVKKELRYRDAFDLFEWVTGVGGGRLIGVTVTRSRISASGKPQEEASESGGVVAHLQEP